MKKVQPLLGGFGKPGEKISEQDGIYTMEGEGIDIGFNLIILEEIKRPSLLEFDIRGKIEKKEAWTRLRIEIFDRDKLEQPATSFEDEYLTVELEAENFKHLSLPILGIVKNPHRVQFMVVGPAKSKIEISNVVLR
ncbi:MAG: hypothetical protein ABIA67_01740 [Candidatus Margulisiibacteriota bacterium]